MDLKMEDHMTVATWPLHYVCRYCSCDVATFPNVRAHEPTTIGLCDKSDCREKASADWKAQR